MDTLGHGTRRRAGHRRTAGGPAPSRPADLGYDKGDRRHPDDDGYRAIADAFDPAWLAMPDLYDTVNNR